MSSDTPTTVRFTIDPASLAVWPSNLPLKISYAVTAYDIAPTWLGWGSPGRTMLGAPDSFSILSDSPTFEIPGYPDYRELDVYAIVKYDPAGVPLGMGGPVPLEIAQQYLGSTLNFVSQPYSLTFFTNRPPTPWSSWPTASSSCGTWRSSSPKRRA